MIPPLKHCPLRMTLNHREKVSLLVGLQLTLKFLPRLVHYVVSPLSSVSETESSHDTSSETLSTENDSESQGTSSAEEDSESQGKLSAEESESHGMSSTEEDSESQDSNLSEEATSVPIPPHQPIPPTITVRRSTRI